jgi:hypothetical protein
VIEEEISDSEETVPKEATETVQEKRSSNGRIARRTGVPRKKELPE